MAPSEPLSLTPVQDSPLFDYPRLDQQLIHTIAYDALVWSSLHGLLVGDKSVQVTHSPTFLLFFSHLSVITKVLNIGHDGLRFVVFVDIAGKYGQCGPNCGRTDS